MKKQRLKTFRLREKEYPNKSEAEKETLLLIPQKHKGSLGSIMNNYLPTNLKAYQKDGFLNTYDLPRAKTRNRKTKKTSSEL